MLKSVKEFQYPQVCQGCPEAPPLGCTEGSHACSGQLTETLLRTLESRELSSVKVVGLPEALLTHSAQYALVGTIQNC